MEYFTAVERNELNLYVSFGIDPKNILLSENRKLLFDTKFKFYLYKFSNRKISTTYLS